MAEWDGWFSNIFFFAMHVQSFCVFLFQALLLPIMNPWESSNKNACLVYQVAQNGPLTSQKWSDIR